MNDTWATNFGPDTEPVEPPAPKRWYRLAHQNLCIREIDFNQRLLLGFTQLFIWPLTTNLRRIHLNCRQCRVHRVLLEAADPDPDAYENGSNEVSDWLASGSSHRLPQPLDLPVVYSDPSQEICSRDTKLRTLDSFQRRHAAVMDLTDPDKEAGEITIRIPPDFWPLIMRSRPVKITLEFSLNKPKAGFYFVVPPGEGSLAERGVHAFTSSVPGSSRLWFPCIDCSEPCTWKIEVTVLEDMVAVAPGEVIDAPYYTEDLRHKTYHFYVAQPVAAPYIGLAVGAFEVYPDPVLPVGSTHFCPSGLLPLLKHTVSNIPEMLEFYEALLASQYPFVTLKTVFVDRAYSEFQAFASLLIFPVDLLHSARIVDQAIETRKIISLAVAHQFFGCFLTMQTWSDAWLPHGMAGYLSGLYQKRVFGNNEYRRIISRQMRHVTSYEHTKYGILLDPTKCSARPTHFSLTSPHTISPNYLAAFMKKAHLIIRMLELRFGQPVLLQVLNKLLVLARLSASSISPTEEGQQHEQSHEEGTTSSPNASEQNSSSAVSPSRQQGESFPASTTKVPLCLSDEHLANLILSTASFRRIISMVTGQDIQNFLDQWIYHSGHVKLFAKFHFNRKRNVLELELKQDLQSRGALNYTGPLTVMLQELDGAFMHTFKMEEGRTSRDLPCHSKSRKHRKKKIPLANGDEVDMDLGRVDAESPVLWVRLDPDLAIIRSIYTDQPDYMWHLMLAHDRDCLGQLEAVLALRDFPSPETRHTLANVIANERVFYRVRMDACFTLCHIVNELSAASGSQATASNAATSCLLPIFWQLFSSPAARGLIRQNNFSHLQHYFLMRAMIRSLATLRVQQVCPREVLTFLSELIRQNDNTRNPFSDCYYKADLIRTMKDTLTPAIVVRGVMSASSLPAEARTVVEEVAHYLNLDTQIQSFKGTVTVACLTAVRRLQRLGFLPVDPSLFYHYAGPGIFYDVRLAALEALVDYVRGERDQSVLDWVFDEIVERDSGNADGPDARLRFETVQLLARMPPFQRGEAGSRLDTTQLVERLWTLMNYGCAADSRLRCAVADLYHILYGTRRPTCLPLPEGVMLVRVKEGRSVLSLTETSGKPDDLEHTATGFDEDEDRVGGDDADGARSFCGGANEDDLLDDVYTDSDMLSSRPHTHNLSDDEKGHDFPHSKLLSTELGMSSAASRDEEMHFPVKRSFPFQSALSESSSVDQAGKRRTQRLSDDEDD